MENTPLSTRRVRRKESFVGRRGADSSELPPSPHSSIFDAFYFSNSNSEESNNNTVVEILPISTADDTSDIPSNDDHEHEFLYGRGTVLDTIVEQKSIATLSTTARTKSVDEFRRDSITERKFPLINHRDSLTIAKVRRQQSFSLDDLSSINRSYHDACRTISGTSTARNKDKHAPVQEIYAQPRTPVKKPPERPLTPEGMPSWTASQQLTSTAGSNTGNQQGRSSRLQRLFGVSPSGFTPPQGRSASAPVRGGRAPRFRPPRSVYGDLASHPFATAPVAKISTRTPSSQLPRPSGRHRLGQNIRSNQAGAESSMLSLHTALQTYYPSPARPTQLASNSPRLAHRCPHYKGRLAALKALAASASGQLHQTGAYVPLNSEPSSASSSPARLPRIREDRGSISISAPSISRPSISTPEVTCWKCRVEHVGSIIDGWWVKSASFLCFVCCGIDINDEADGAAGARWIGVTHSGVSVREWDVEMGRERENQRVDEMRDRRTVRAVMSETPVLL